MFVTTVHYLMFRIHCISLEHTMKSDNDYQTNYVMCSLLTFFLEQTMLPVHIFAMRT